MRPFLTLLMAVIVGAVLAEDTPHPKEVTIDGAFRFHGKLYLVSGDEFMAITPDNFEGHVMKRDGSRIALKVDVKGVVAWPGRDNIYFYGAGHSFRLDTGTGLVRTAAYGSSRAFIQEGGPDAVSFKGGQFYFFKGCRHTTTRNTISRFSGRSRLNSDLGLPCDIDAAWTSDDHQTMTVLKGDKIWKWQGDDVTATGPEDFEDTYHIYSWRLKPTVDDRFRF